MNVYKAVYKCQLCGEIYEHRISREEAKQAIESLPSIFRMRPEKEVYENPIPIYVAHICKDNSCGLAYLQGFRKREVTE